jgi:hypothetical protein
MNKSKTLLLVFLSTLVMTGFLYSCSSNSKRKIPMKASEFVRGTFGYDQSFLSRYKETVLLSDSTGKSALIIVPGWQARVMTSTTNGAEGFSYGWINYKLIESKRTVVHINAFGGEERLWLGPEGGQFSIYFPKGAKQEFDNWQVPAELDTVAFDLVSRTNRMASFRKDFRLTNYSGTSFEIGIERSIELLKKSTLEEFIGMALPDSVRAVAYQSDNSIENKGDQEWTKQTGILSVWMLSMLNPSPEVTLFIPYRNSKSITGKILNDDYFGKVPENRLMTENGMIWFKADGKYRSKIGIPPQRASNLSASYDAKRKALTLLWCDIPEGRTDYVNSKWGIQEDAYSGDAINAYNDGPLTDGSQMGPFYEMESSSPAANLKPGEKLKHQQRIFHLEGPEASLGLITNKLLGVSIEEIKTKFPN